MVVSALSACYGTPLVLTRLYGSAAASVRPVNDQVSWLFRALAAGLVTTNGYGQGCLAAVWSLAHTLASTTPCAGVLPPALSSKGVFSTFR